MRISTFVSVVQRRIFTVESTDMYLIPLLEPLFQIPTHTSYEERLKLFQLGLSLEQGFVACELGSYLGSSTAFLATAASLKQGHIHAVDTWKNDGMPGEPVVDTYDDFIRNTLPLRHQITVHRGRIHEMKDQIPQVDLLFIDGDHSYEGVFKDLTDCAGKVRPGGILALHDFTYETVANAVRDYFQDRPLEDLGRTHSLQVYRLR